VKTRLAALMKNQASRSFREVGVYGEYSGEGCACLADVGGSCDSVKATYARLMEQQVKPTRGRRNWVDEK